MYKSVGETQNSARKTFMLGDWLEKHLLLEKIDKRVKVENSILYIHRITLYKFNVLH